MGYEIRKRTALKKADDGKAKTRNAFLIIVDTREQKPLWVEGVLRKKLEVGDYSTQKLEGVFAVERKSGTDLYSSIIHGHGRFMREIQRAKLHQIKLVVYVESTKKDFINLKFANGHKRKIKSATLEKIINTVIKRRTLEVVWCLNRQIMKKKVLFRLKKEERNLKKSLKQNKL